MRYVLNNYMLSVTVTAYLIAQISKFFLYSFISGRFELSRILGSGGMPSSHSASVTALAVSCIRQNGISSPFSAIAIVLAIIVVHDAVGVRRQSGIHAQVLNQVLDLLPIEMTKQLNEFIGHTFMQSLVGCLLGTAVALLFPLH